MRWKKTSILNANPCPGPFDQKHQIWENYEGQLSINQIMNKEFFLKNQTHEMIKKKH